MTQYVKRTFVCSDLHFQHQRILGFGRPFSTLDEHDNTIINNWNTVVDPRDDVIVCGDLVFGGKQNLSLFSRMHGRKLLVLGNHDGGSKELYLPYFAKIEGSMEIRTSKGTILFTHFPVHPNQMTVRYALNVHGHVHANTIMDGNQEDQRYFNVSMENINYTPIILDKIRHLRKARFDDHAANAGSYTGAD